MWKHTKLIKSDEEFLYGRIRTMNFLGSILEDINKQSEIMLKPVKFGFIPPESAWDFIIRHKMEWIIESQEDDAIRNEFRRLPLPENLKQGIHDFLRAHIPGPLYLESVFKGEDLGIEPYPHLFPPRYIIDFPTDFNERYNILEQHIKDMWSLSFKTETKQFMKSLHIPVADWMTGVIVSEYNVPRRGSFYYPDASATLWNRDGKHLTGLAVPGCWAPLHPDFPETIKFSPGKRLQGSPSSLLALEAIRGKEKLIPISRHLAKTHGTQNLSPVKNDAESYEEYKKLKSTKKQTPLFYGENSRFSNLAKTLMNQSFELMGEPVTANLRLQPDTNTLEPVIYVNWIKPYTPSFSVLPLPKPKHNNTVLFDNLVSEGVGSVFARYYIKIKEKPDFEEISEIKKTAASLAASGETLIISISSDISKEDFDIISTICSDISSEHPETAFILPKKALGIMNNTEISSAITIFSSSNQDIEIFDKLPDFKNKKSYSLKITPKLVKLTSENGSARAWL